MVMHFFRFPRRSVTIIRPPFNQLISTHCILLVAAVFALILVSDGGKVNVADSVTKLYQNEIPGSVRVAFSEVVVDSKINVTCIQRQHGLARAKLSFEYATFPVGSSSGNISVRVIAAGLPVSVACFGFSLNLTRQFSLANSTGRLGVVNVLYAPTVSICSDYVYIKGYTKTEQRFTVQLSEPAVAAVTVNCFVANESSVIANSLKLSFSQATVAQRQSTTAVTFRVRKSGLPVKVFCRAHSQNCFRKDGVATSTTVTALSSGVATSFVAPSSFSYKSRVPIYTSDVTTVVSTVAKGHSVISSHTASFIGNSTSHSTSASASGAILSVTSSATSGSASSLSRSYIRSSVTKSSLFTSSMHSLKSSAVLPSPTPTVLPLPTRFCQYLFETSQAPPVNFVVSLASITAYPSYSDFDGLGDHVSYVALDRALEGTSNLVLQCALKQVNITDTGLAICGADGLPIGGGSELALDNIAMKLLERKITFKPGTQLGNITVRITRLGNQSFSQLFHAFCCAPPSSEKYRQKSVSVFLWIDTKGILPFDLKNIPGQEQRVMTAVETLDFTCPCNLNQGSCDFNCCCDPDCSVAETTRFVCIKGAFGGRETNSFEFDCNAVWPDRTDWTPILCVVTNNSPLLGYFFKYTSPALALTSNDFQTLTIGKVGYSFEENEPRTSVNGGSIGYVFGSAIKTDVGLLTVPSQIGDSTCDFTAVRYLMDKTSSCLQEALPSACNGIATFNALNFMLPSGLTLPSCSVPGILDGTTSTSVASVSVEYYCLTDPSDYLYLSVSSLPSPVAQESLFTSRKPSTAPRCSFDTGRARPPQPTVNNTTCENAVFGVDYVITWSAKRIRALTAKITLGSFPINSVTESAVTYTYYTERVVTSSFPVPSSIATPRLTTSKPSAFPSARRSFTVAFKSVSSRDSSTALLLSSVITPSPLTLRSLPTSALYSGTSHPFVSSTFGTLSTAAPSLLASSAYASALVPAKPKLMTSMVKTSTVIARNFTFTPSILQKFTVSFKYERIVEVNASVSLPANSTTIASTVVTRSGNPGYVTGRPLITKSNSTSNTTSTDGLLLWKATSDGHCASSTFVSVPFGKNSFSGCAVRFGLDKFANCSQLRSLIKSNQDKLVKGMQIARRGNPSASNPDDWIDIIRVEPVTIARNVTRAGICYDIPSHVVIEVLISEAGMFYGEPQMEISGLKIRYLTGAWSMDCMSGANAACYDATTAASKFVHPVLKSFHLMSSVVFVKIPAVDPPRLKRSAVTSGVCKYDACLKQLFYPITNGYSYGLADFDLRHTQEATAVAMALIFVAFGAFYASRPWLK